MDRMKEVEQMAKLNGVSADEYCQQVIGNAVHAIAYMSLKGQVSSVVIGDSRFMVSLVPMKEKDIDAAKWARDYIVGKNNG